MKIIKGYLYSSSPSNTAEAPVKTPFVIIHTEFEQSGIRGASTMPRLIHYCIVPLGFAPSGRTGRTLYTGGIEIRPVYFYIKVWHRWICKQPWCCVWWCWGWDSSCSRNTEGRSNWSSFVYSFVNDRLPNSSWWLQEQDADCPPSSPVKCLRNDRSQLWRSRESISGGDNVLTSDFGELVTYAQYRNGWCSGYLWSLLIYQHTFKLAFFSVCRRNWGVSSDQRQSTSWSKFSSMRVRVE